MNDTGEVAPPFLAECDVPSSTRPGHTYHMVETASGEWVHADAGCEAFQHSRPCSHGEQAKKMMPPAPENEPVPDSRVLALRSPLEMVEHIDLDAIISDMLVDPGAQGDRHPWVYRFKVKGKDVIGIAADGVQDAARALAFKGETIRVMYVRIDHEDEDYAYFTAAAARYAISPSGQEICLDSTIRGKRQAKFMMVGRYEGSQKVGETKQEDDAWYEKGLTKASRNVIEAMLPEALKVELIRRALGNSQARQLPAGRAAGGDTRQRRRDPLPPLTGESPGAYGPDGGPRSATPPAPAEPPVEAEYTEHAGDAYDGLTYAEARANPAQHFKALNAFLAKYKGKIPDDMAHLPMTEILRKLAA